VRSRRPAFALRVLPVALAVLVSLALAAPARAQVAGAAPMVFKNSTDTTLVIESEKVVDSLGEYNPKLTWTLRPGAYTYLNNSSGGKIFARQFACVVKAGGKDGRWTWTLNGADANGNFVMEFTQDTLRAQLGGQVVGGPGTAPPPNGPTQQQMQNATVKILIAAIAHHAAKKAREKPGAGLGEAVAEGLALGVRDGAIQSALRDLFPRLTPRQSGDVQRLLSSALDGQLILDNDAQQAKQRLINDLRNVDPNLADAAVIADFIYMVSQRRPR
jgi:hypothetical protein